MAQAVKSEVEQQSLSTKVKSHAAYADAKEHEAQGASATLIPHAGSNKTESVKARSTASKSAKADARMHATVDSNQYSDAMNKIINKHKLGAPNPDGKGSASLMLRRKQMQTVHRPQAFEGAQSQPLIA